MPARSFAAHARRGMKISQGVVFRRSGRSRPVHHPCTGDSDAVERSCRAPSRHVYGLPIVRPRVSCRIDDDIDVVCLPLVYRGGLLYGQALLWLLTAWTQFLMRLAGPQWSAVHGRSGRGTSGRLSLDRGLCGGSAQQACCRALRRGVLCSVEAANVGEHVH